MKNDFERLHQCAIPHWQMHPANWALTSCTLFAFVSDVLHGIKITVTVTVTVAADAAHAMGDGDTIISREEEIFIKGSKWIDCFLLWVVEKSYWVCIAVYWKDDCKQYILINMMGLRVKITVISTGKSDKSRHIMSYYYIFFFIDRIVRFRKILTFFCLTVSPSTRIF